MIVVLSYSTSWCQNNVIPSTGELSDSLVLVPIEAIKIANSKMIELKYQKEINDSLRSIISNDSAIISEYKELTNKKDRTINKVKKQRNSIVFGSAILILLALFL